MDQNKDTAYIEKDRKTFATYEKVRDALVTLGGDFESMRSVIYLANRYITGVERTWYNSHLENSAQSAPLTSYVDGRVNN